MVEIPVEIAVLHNFLATTNKNMAVYLKKIPDMSMDEYENANVTFLNTF
jgi:hypothetical protein